MWEGLMLICFGVSWPPAIIKTLRVKNPAGKSFIFMMLVLTGYLSGIIGKIVNEQISYVLILYCINLIVVSVDLGLYFVNAKREKLT